MSYCKYKDAPPEVTINKIKECFRSIGIELEERVVMRMEGIFSSTILDRNTGWAAAGKGTNELYCLASGYAEAMEHFCNYCAYDLSILDEDAQKYLGFYRYPDERRIAITNFDKINSGLRGDIEAAFTLEGDSFSEEKAIEAWSSFLENEEISLVPYYSVKNKKVEYLPEAVLGKLCGSTGGGAGNTPEEAIGHALDEISERYAKYVIYSQELTPPDVSKEFIADKCPELYRIIAMIEEKGNYKVLIKDASLGKNYPVLAVCLINQDTHSYVVNFGAHPVFKIALERCLTEMFQFMNLNTVKSTRHKKMTKWSSFERETHSIRNWTSLLRDDTGTIPTAFFAGESSWDFEPWGFYENYSNKKGMQQQICNFLNNNVKDIFIRDFSFLGFPVYRVYIPGVSVSHFTINDRTMYLFSESSRLVKCIVNNEIEKLEVEDIEVLEEAFSKKSYVGTWVIRSLNEDYLDLLHAALIKDSINEQEALKEVVEIETDFAKAIIEDSIMHKQGKKIEERNTIIELFYGKFVMDLVHDWRNEDTFISLIKLYRDYKLVSIKKGYEYIEPIQLVHKKLKEKMVKELPSQKHIQSVVEDSQIKQ